MEPVVNKLLIVDDDAELRRTLNVTLHQRGFDVDLVDEGLSALKLIEKSIARGLPYGCVVADLKLPDIDGLKLVEVIKAKYPAMPVIIISGYASADTATVRRVPLFHVREEPRPRAEPAHRSVSAYSLVTLAPGADAEAVFRTLFFMDDVVYCDAVHGDTDVVMLLNAPTSAELERVANEIRNVRGVGAATVNEVVKPELDRALARFLEAYDEQRNFDPLERKRALGPNSLSTYLLVDVERGRLADVQTRLSLDDAVLFCDAVAGGYDLIALVQTTSSTEYQRLLSEELKRIDGIVRTLSLAVVNVLET